MTKILFVCRSLHSCGGVETAFVNMIKSISKNDCYDIDVISFSLSDANKSQLKDKVSIIHTNKFIEMLGKSQKEFSCNSILYWLRLFLVLICKIFGNEKIFRILFKNIHIENDYEYAVSFIQASGPNVLSDGTNQLVLDYVKSNKKVTVIHSDYSSEKFDNSYHRNLYSQFDIILTVSESCKQELIKVEPQFERKTRVLYNFYDIHSIIEKSNEFNLEFDKDVVNFVTVARFNKEKGLLRMLDSLHEISKKNDNFCWHLVGDGELKKAIQEKVAKYNLSDKVKLYGAQNNPYPYIKNSDCLVVCSLYEAAPMVIGEAKILNVPVLSTKTLSALEQVSDNGIVCDNSLEGLNKAISKILENPKVLEQFKEKLRREIFSNDKSEEQFSGIFK